MGKTTLAAAAALAAAGDGGRVLIVSTDPAHSLGDALAARLGPGPRPVAVPPEGSAGELLAAEIDAPAAFSRWLADRRGRLRALAERGTLLDAEDLDRLLELPAPGVDELAGLLEAARLGRETGCDLLVVDTAPTAHTLRLVAMPAALRRFAALLAAMRDRRRAVAEALVGGAPADDADGLAAAVDAEAGALEELLRDPQATAFSWVLLPEEMAVAETADALAELAAAGIAPGRMVRELIVNRLTPPPPERCRVCSARRRAEAAAIAGLAGRLPGIAIRTVPERDREPRGPAALAALWRSLGDPPPAPRPSRRPPPEAEAKPATEVPAWLDRLVPPGLRLLFVAGKGGVGKTTCAAAIALLAARRRPERPVLLLSTDPAHSLGDVLGAALGDRALSPPGAPANLRARELDAAAAFAARREALEAALDEAVDDLLGAASGKRSGIDAPFDRRLLERLLEGIPPGLDELVAMAELTEALDEEGGGAGLTVVDTAPTGHALRLLDTPDLALAWSHALMAILLRHRRVTGLGRLAEELLALARGARRLAAALGDPDRTRFLVVARPAELPRRETGRLLAALGRRRLAVAGLVVNAVSPAAAGCRRCAVRRKAEEREVERLRRVARSRGRGAAGGSAILLAPAAIPPPIGPAALARWARRWRIEAPADRPRTDRPAHR